MTRDSASPDDTYGSIEDGPEAELTVKGSSFLAQAFRVDDEATAGDRVDRLRRRYHDATHHCWAFRIHPRGGRLDGSPVPPVESTPAWPIESPPAWPVEDPRERWDDDGEPSGTAGPPILGALRHAGLHDALVVVTRYFGGTKLGTGGLSRAYGDTARLALERTRPRTIWRLAVVQAWCSFDSVGAVEATLARAGAAVHRTAREFSPEPVYTIDVVRSRVTQLREQLIEATAGKARVVITSLSLSDANPR
jgi:putative IMPACT (imprinted ancient) family translation regulator